MTTPPDRASFERDLAGAAYRFGELAARWHLVRLDWPVAVITIGASARTGAPANYGFRFECSGYPALPPNAQPWDLEANQPLPAHRWPGGRNVVADVFRPDWEQGRALYHPCDRVTISTHPDWKNQHPNRLWRPERGIAFFLEQLHDLLHSSHYSGLRAA
jgi:hypothetical protein